MGLVRLIVAACLGAALLCELPRPGVLASTQELIAFLALIMAGLLPAMILTATILRSANMLPSEIEGYGASLRRQLDFWAVLFGASGLSTLGVVAAKIFSADKVAFALHAGPVVIDNKIVTTVSLLVAGAGLGVVVQRLRAAYVGLASLLDLNIIMSKGEAYQRQNAATARFGQETSKAAASDDRPYEHTSTH